MLERRATPDGRPKRAFGHLRDAGFDNISLDLIYGIPGQTPPSSPPTSPRRSRSSPSTSAAYELEAKPGTRFTIAHGAELERQADAMEDYFERVVAHLTGAGYRWYETANFCRRRDERRRSTTSATGSATTISASGSARSRRSVTSAGATRRSSRATCRAHYDREIELLDEDTRARERVMLGLRLDEPLPLGGLRSALDAEGLARAEELGLAVDGGETLRSLGAAASSAAR